MKKRRIVLLSLLLMAVGMSAEQSLVPAMIVQGTNGIRHVVPLDATDVTDLLVLQNGQSMQIDIPEAQVNGVRCITFAMVPTNQTAIETTETALIRNVEKVVRDGQVIIRLLFPNGTTMEYDIHGNQIINQ